MSADTEQSITYSEVFKKTRGLVELSEKSIGKEYITNNIDSFLDIYKEYVNQGVINRGNINDADQNGRTLLHYLCQMGEIKLIHLIMELHPNINLGQKATQLTPLHFASRKTKDSELVAFLIACGANINARTKKGFTPLTEAILFGNIPVINLLLEEGAKIGVSNENGYSDLHFPALQGNEPVMKTLLKGITNNQRNEFIGKGNASGASPLHVAAANGAVAVAALLLANGANIEQLDSNLFTPLHIAAGIGNLELIRLFLDQEADINARAISERTPLLYAAEQGEEEAIKLLLDRGANVQDAAENGFTALHFAALKGNVPLAEMLFTSGALVNANLGGYTPLICACAAEKINESFLELLFKKGADVNLRTVDGITALLLAVKSGNKMVVNRLLELGANVDGKNTQDLEIINSHTNSNVKSKPISPIKTALKEGGIDIIRLLLNHSPSPILDNEDRIKISTIFNKSNLKLEWISLSARGFFKRLQESDSFSGGDSNTESSYNDDKKTPKP